jgi:AcrR family transcriptional regulator
MPKVSEAHLEARYRQILNAAVACFARNGFHETTMQDICQEAGLSPGALYRYFASKEEMVEASWRRDQQARADRFERALKQGDTVLVLDELMDIYAKRLSDPETQTDMRLWIQLLAEALRNPRVAEAIRNAWEDVLKRFENIIQRAQERGEASTNLDPGAVARLCLAIHDGLVLQRTIDPDMDIPKYAEAAKALFGGSFITAGGKGDK